MTAPDSPARELLRPLRPLRTEDDVITHCRLHVDDPYRLLILDVYAHAIVAMRVTTVRDLDAIDGPIGEFLRTGAVPSSPRRRVWEPLYGTVYGTLPTNQRLMADMIGLYLEGHAGRGPVDGWPCA